MTSVSLVDWKIEPRRIERPAQLHRRSTDCRCARPRSRRRRVRRKAAGRCAARSRPWSNSGRGRSPTRPGSARITSSRSKLPATWPIARWEWKCLPSTVVMPARFLAAMLQRVKAERDEARRIVGAPYAENAALLAQLVVIERIGRQHRRRPLLAAWNRDIGRAGALVAPGQPGVKTSRRASRGRAAGNFFLSAATFGPVVDHDVGVGRVLPRRNPGDRPRPGRRPAVSILVAIGRRTMRASSSWAM